MKLNKNLSHVIFADFPVNVRHFVALFPAFAPNESSYKPPTGGSVASVYLK